MERKEAIRSAYRITGENGFYDGMITCSTLSGKAVCRLVWAMNKAENDAYLEKALSGIPEHFSGKLLEVPVGTGILTMPVYQTMPEADITCLDYSPDMMRQAREKANRLNLNNVTFQQGDVGALPYADAKAELKAIAGDDKEIEDRFYRTLEFGTAGLRGVIGAGTNRMNIYTVRQATQGLANYILAQGGQEKGVAIAHDSRLMADEFTDAAALCLAANGIKTYVFKSLRPVPELSFAVRTLGCIAGIVITASHNPREYNGYKVYWEDGAQVTPPHDTGIMAEVAKVTSFDMVKTMEKEKARRWLIRRWA